MTEDQLTAAMIEKARQYPGQEKTVVDHYRNSGRARDVAPGVPSFEDKVVDFLVVAAKVTEKPVSRDELFKEDEE